MTRIPPVRRRVLIVPAAGAGTRLKSPLPKLLVPVAGRAMIDHVLDLYADVVQHVVIVVSPAAVARVTEHVRTRGANVDLAVQERPTGMLDAILVPHDVLALYACDEIWVTWCDQVAVDPATVMELAERTVAGDAAFVFPTCRSPRPYIHFERDGSGRIVRVLQRREADPMPDEGESDMGLFAMTRETYVERLPAFARDPELGTGTGERNFLPFIPWLARSARVDTFPCRHRMEAVGINTPDDLRAIEEHVRQRVSRASVEDSR